MIGLPFVVTTGRSPRIRAAVQALAGATSLLLGLALVAGVADA